MENIFEKLEQTGRKSLAGLSGREFQEQYGKFGLLLVRTSDRVPVAGILTSDRDVARANLPAEFERAFPGEQLRDYALQDGPTLISSAFQRVAATDTKSPQSNAERVLAEDAGERRR